MAEKAETSFSVRFDEVTLARIDKQVERLKVGVSRAAAIRWMIELGLERLEKKR